MSERRFETRIPLRGHLRIIRRDAKTKKLLDVWEKRNVITFTGAEIIVRLMTPNVAFGVNVQVESQIKSMRFGLSNTSPQRTDLDLADEAIVSSNPVRIELLDANRIVGASGTVEYTATLNSATGNGVTYREAGLFTRGTADDPLVTTAADMFARQVYPDQPKSAAVELEFRWRITLTV